MTQLKVFEFAKEIGVETLHLMDKIREWKLPVRSHMATLDDQMMAEIKTRLAASTAQAAEEAAKAKKKAVRKKAADAKAEAAPSAGPAAKKTTVAKPTTKATVTKAAAAPKAPAKAAPAAKSVTKTKAKAAPTPDVAPPVSMRTVIRRKAGELEAKAAEAAEAARVQAEQDAQAQAQADLDAGIEPGSEQSAQPAATGAPTEGTPATPEVAVAKPRRNIVGRMDLRRVTNITGPTGSGPGGSLAGAGQPRVSRTAPRSIRTGFYSAEPAPAPQPLFDNQREDPKKRRPGAPAASGGGREEVVKIFTATEFRKREVIFQPKKKKSMIGRDSKKTQLTTPAAHKRVVKVDGNITLNNLAAEIGVKAPQLMKKLMAQGVTASMNQALDFDTVALIVPEFGWEAQNTHRTVDELLTSTIDGDVDAEKVTRPPVVTIMGHVDHGKTTLLDSIRKAKVAAGEAGGITQHIGAYSVTLDDGNKVTFIDTPGHEAFTAMRARGANATDIAIIVVAADDGMMPQTAEAINHAKAAGVPIIVAVNKMDKPGANPERIKQQLTELELVPEEWGGTTIYVPVSAIKGEGINELLEQIHLVAEILELKANPARSGKGVVIEARMEKGRGSVATILVKDGTVKVGQLIVAGTVTGRIRSMADDQGKVVKEMGPGMACEVLGLPEPPMAGDAFDVVADEETGRRIAEQRRGAVVREETPNSKMSLEQLFSRVKSGDTKELSLVLKVDVAGSLEAIKGMLAKLGNTEVKVKLIHSGVGGVSESDVLLANTAKGVIVGFNVRPDTGAMRMAKEKGIEIKSYSIIYELMDDLKKSLSGLLVPIVVEKAMGRAEVRNVFNVPKGGTIAGCFVVDGKIARNNMLRLLRDSKIIYEGKVSSLKRFKDDAKEVAAGFECGVGIENFNDIKVGDVIESFVKEEQVREL